MAVNIFVDIADTLEVTTGNIVSLCEFFRQDLCRRTGLDVNEVHTDPCIVRVEDDVLEIFSSRMSFRFSPSTGILYKPYDSARSEVDIFEECFDSNVDYIVQNYRRDASPVILTLITAFMMYFDGGNEGLRTYVFKLSKGRFDYARNKRDEWCFWYRRNDGDWGLSSLCRFTDYFYDRTRSFKYEVSDKYFMNELTKKGTAHLGYFFITFTNLLARASKRRDTDVKLRQNKAEAIRDSSQKNSTQGKKEKIEPQTQPDRVEKIKSTSDQTQSSAVKNEPLIEEEPYRKRKLDELTMADCNEISRKFLRKLYESGTDKVKKLYFCSLQDSKSQKKFMNAIKAYARLVPHEIPILCFDDTVFGGAEDGFLVTTRGIHIHNQNETSAKFVSFKDIESITLNEGFAQSKLVINNEIKIVMMGLEHADCNNIFVAVNFVKVCLEIYD